MRKSVFSGIGCAVVLAATTALGSGAWAQSFTVSDTVSQAETIANGSAFVNNNFPTDRFQITIVDAANLSLTLNSANFASLFPTQAYVGVRSEAQSTAGTIFPALPIYGVDSSGGTYPTTLDLSGIYANGRYELFVGSDYPSVVGGPYSFTVNGASLGWGPATATQLSALSQGTASLSRGVVIQAGSVAATQANDGLSSDTTASSRGTNPTPVNTWVEFTGFVTNGNDLRQTATGFQLGGDMHVMSNLALGLSIGHSEVNSDAGGFDLSGDLTFVQPYLAYVNGPMRAEASLIYGRGDYEQISLGGTGTADSTVVAATLSGAYDLALSTGQTLSPMASLSYGEEESKGTGGTLAGAGTETTNFGRASVGARLSTNFDMGTAFVGVHADYDYSNGDTNVIAGFDDDTGLAGRVELGVNAAITDRLDLRTNMSVGGLGTSTKDVAAGLTLSMSF